MSPHDATTDSTRCYPLTGRHAQVAAILGHHPHGGRVRLTVTELGQIGELVAREQWLVVALYAALRALGGVPGLPGTLHSGFQTPSGAEGAADREVA